MDVSTSVEGSTPTQTTEAIEPAPEAPLTLRFDTTRFADTDVASRYANRYYA